MKQGAVRQPAPLPGPFAFALALAPAMMWLLLPIFALFALTPWAAVAADGALDPLLSTPFTPVYPPAERPNDTTTTALCGIGHRFPTPPPITGPLTQPTPEAPQPELFHGQAYAVIAFYFTAARWTLTATDGAATGTSGDPVQLTYSFPPDGINVPAYSGLPSEVASPNILHQKLDQQFLSREIWTEQFRRIFMRWSRYCGAQYTEVSDDGGAFSTAPGALGARGDVRIVGHHIDGASGSNVLAYSGFPNTSDMVLDTDNNWANSLNHYRYLRNVLGHEEGHALALDHPENRADTQWLMEPIISTAFDGPQEDDIRAVQRLYGDADENNDSSASATDLGTIGASEGGAMRLELSTDSAADVDWFRFDLSAGDQVTVTVTPVGTTYTLQKQGQPVQGTVDAMAVADLHFTLYQANASTVIADINATAAGAAETATATLAGGATYYLKVFAQSGADDVQRYRLAVLPAGNTRVAPTPVAPFNRVSATGRVFATARESFDPDHSGDANRGIVKVEWDLDNNGSFEFLGVDAGAVYTAPGLQFARLRVTDSDGLTTVTQFQVNVLAATETKTIQLTQPNSGAMLIGASQTITWNTSGAIAAAASIAIEISYDAGFSWTVITAATLNDGSFTWGAVTGPASNSVLIRVSDAGDPAIFDTPDSQLAVAATPTIVLNSPAGGESYNLGYPVLITWSAIGVTQPIKIELSRDGGSTFPTLIAAAAPNSGSFTWTATAPAGAQNRIRVSDSTNGAIADTGGNFTLAATPTLSLTAPVGGETFTQTTTTSVTWSSTGSIAQVNLEFSADSGVSFVPVASNLPNTGSYTWTVTQQATTQGRLRLSDAAAPAVVQAVTPADFTIPPPVLTVTSPNGGQTYTQGETRTIAWTTSGYVPTVDLDLSLDNGGTWTALATNLTNTGSYSWSITQATSSQALIRVRDHSQPAVIQDGSDNPFTILSGVGLGAVTVVHPNGGEILPAASAQSITWQSTGFVPAVKIEVSTNGGVTWQTVAAATPNTGSQSWTTPAFYYSAMLVRVTDSAAAGVTDQSDSTFQIGVQPRKKSKGCAVTGSAGAGSGTGGGDFGLPWWLIAAGLAASGRGKKKNLPHRTQKAHG